MPAIFVVVVMLAADDAVVVIGFAPTAAADKAEL